MVFKSAQDIIDEMNSKSKSRTMPLANGPNTVEKPTSATASADTSNVAKYGEICQKIGGQIYKNGNICKLAKPKMDIEFTWADKGKWTGKVLQGEA